MSDLDRSHSASLLGAAGLDGLVLFQPEAFRYAIGVPAGVATMWGRAGSAIALVPCDASQRLGAVVSDHVAVNAGRLDVRADVRVHRIWIDSVALRGDETLGDLDNAYRHASNTGSRPETFDRDQCFQLLADLLRERGLHMSRLGSDLSFLPAADFAALQRATPDVIWQDASEIVLRLRAIKNPDEIGRLRRAAHAAEVGLLAIEQQLASGMSVAELSAIWLGGARRAAAEGGHGLSGHWDYISVGPRLADATARVSPGALIKADVGTLVDGYSSDGARTFVFGTPAALARDIHAVLHEAFLTGLEEIRPGRSFGQVHAAMLATMRRHGLNEYYRGHFGHSVGGNAGIEEWPFFSAGNQEIIQPNMVLALETPFYGEGLGALMIEDQFLVTDQGVERMTTMPWDLTRI